MRIKDVNERKFYEIESFKNNWSLRELQRQYDSALYSRLALSKNKEEILQLSEKGQILEKPKDLIKSSFISRFPASFIKVTNIFQPINLYFYFSVSFFQNDAQRFAA